MPVYKLPYGRGQLQLRLPGVYQAEVIIPRIIPALPDPQLAVQNALANPLGGFDRARITNAASVMIAVSDKTRPVPNHVLLPVLLDTLLKAGIQPGNISFIIATGTHAPMQPDEFELVLPQHILREFPVSSHDCDDQSLLRDLGRTSRETPVSINQRFLDADLRIVAGIIEPHQIQGFSGGVKGAAIGLAARRTINHNHAMLFDPSVRLGSFTENPARQDLEEIGEMIDVHLVLDAVLNQEKQIVEVIAGEPGAVMERGVKTSRRINQLQTSAPYDIVFASPGGYPKDINLYQSQKALAHASLITREGGILVLSAACSQEVGVDDFREIVQGYKDHRDLVERFPDQEFRVGPHKLFQIARDAVDKKVYLVSDMDASTVRAMLMEPLENIDAAVRLVKMAYEPGMKVAVIPVASSTIPIP